MKLFKKYSLVPTRNIKQYMVDEFKRANELEILNRDKDDRIEELTIDINKKGEELQKANIILEQFKYKIGKSKENYENDLETYKKKIEKLEKELSKTKEESNNYQIKVIEQNKIIDDLKKQLKELNKNIKDLKKDNKPKKMKKEQ